jgi:hypothetical protein
MVRKGIIDKDRAATAYEAMRVGGRRLPWKEAERRLKALK